MRVLIAPASLKECLSAADAARAMAHGAARAGAETVELPLADGGRGTLECLAAPMGLEVQRVEVAGPLGGPVVAAFGLGAGIAVAGQAGGAAAGAGDPARPSAGGRRPRAETAVMEMASASGLALVPPGKRDALRATTRGTGELLRAAIERGARQIFLGIGDSATSDGGAGMAQALGVGLLDERGAEVGPGAAGLARLARLDRRGRHEGLAQVQVLVACDVDNPLLGPRGAARVFSAQKGATPRQIEEIEQNLAHLADLIHRDLGINVREIPGGGAAGGLGAGAVAFLGARLMSGAEWVLEALEIEDRLIGIDLALTAEGRFDAQSLGGKAPMALARRARAAGVPCAVIPGSIGPGHEPALKMGVSALFPLVRGNVTLSDAMGRAAELLAARAEEAVRRFARARALGVRLPGAGRP